jgi:hypothetical protein
VCAIEIALLVGVASEPFHTWLSRLVIFFAWSRAWRFKAAMSRRYWATAAGRRGMGFERVCH